MTALSSGKIPASVALAAAAGASPRRVRFPVVSTLAVPGQVALRGLGDPVVSLEAALHPALAGWLQTAGWVRVVRRDGSVWLPPSRPVSVEDPVLDPLRPSFASEVLSALVRGGAPVDLPFEVPGLRGALRVAPGRLTLRCAGRLLTGAEVLGLDMSTGLLAAAASWFPFEGLLRSSLVVSADPVNPCVARLLDGGEVRSVSCVEALSLVERRHLEMPVALEPAVLDVAAVATSGPADREGLFPFQDAMVSALVSSDTGLLIASPPGTGKTVVVASALSEVPGVERGLVVAPAPLLGQWVAELSSWAPGLSVGCARTAAQVTPLLRRCQLVVLSPQTAARWEGSSRQRLDLVVVDEGVVLLRSSKTSSALWRLRERSRMAWVLTGSPDEVASRGGCGRLVQFVRGLPAAPVAASASDLWPLVQGADVAGRVPECRVQLLPVAPSLAEKQALSALPGALPASGLARTQAVDGLRRALSWPVGQATGSSKLEAVVAAVTSEVASGGRVLLFGSSLPLLQRCVEDLEGLGSALLSGSDRAGRVRVLSAFAEGAVSVLGVSPGSQRGVNLQAASAVVHLDLPLSRAEFDQRNGRAARIGSVHDEVKVLVPCYMSPLDEFLVGRLANGDEDFSLERLLSEWPPH